MERFASQLKSLFIAKVRYSVYNTVPAAPILCKEILALFHMKQDLIPYPEKAVHWFPAENHGLRYGGLIRIPNASHSAAYPSSECCRSQADDKRPNKCSKMARPRLSSAILLAIGGWSGSNPTKCIEAYDIHANSWVSLLDDMDQARAYCGAAFLHNAIYCLGGFDGTEHYNTVSRFDLNTHTWQEVAPMHFRRCYVSVTVLNGCIYAIGGHDGRVRLKTAEYYTPETNQWTLIASMQEQRSDASCTALNDKVYICGGFNGNESLQTAEYYNPETNKWTATAPMSCRRSGIGVIGHAGHVYAVGGYDGQHRLASAEAYNPETDTWIMLPPMQCPRSNFGIEVVEDCLFVAGGFSGFSTTNLVEYYDLKLGTWSAANCMGLYRSALSCCVMSGLPNIAQYTMLRNDLPLLFLEDDSLDMEDEV
ncbi:kelch-like protein 10 [Corythoichthys intestinalis]|uniref:kelch-like protein 10 n=1 Tax=Corythoichthys intestinalis TaxID=161448 RepID=UPI0025A63D41|nr:kelch-like protein 10 [Corythoichthys intestinalis]